MGQLIWLWLEDDIAKEKIIAELIYSIIGKDNIIIFKHEDPFLKFIKKQVDENKFDNFGIISKIMLPNRPFAIQPPNFFVEGGKGAYHKTRENGHDIGLIIYEKIIIPLFRIKKLKLPPTIFLSTISLDSAYTNIKKRLENINLKWELSNNSEYGKGILFVNKWNVGLKKEEIEKELKNFLENL